MMLTCAGSKKAKTSKKLVSQCPRDAQRVRLSVIDTAGGVGSSKQLSFRELAKATGRSISWIKKWRKRLTKGDPHDPSVLCSRSRAHHAPYFRWDTRVIQRMVEMRFAPPENLKRIPAP